jgi:hypothetical protein
MIETKTIEKYAWQDYLKLDKINIRVYAIFDSETC